MASISDQSQNCGKQIPWYCVSIAHGRMHYGAADLVTIVSTGELNNNSGLSIFHFFSYQSQPEFRVGLYIC